MRGGYVLKSCRCVAKGLHHSRHRGRRRFRRSLQGLEKPVSRLESSGPVPPRTHRLGTQASRVGFARMKTKVALKLETSTKSSLKMLTEERSEVGRHDATLKDKPLQGGNGKR